MKALHFSSNIMKRLSFFCSHNGANDHLNISSICFLILKLSYLSNHDDKLAFTHK
jgi:hypothetical protein